jgi:hypothetical protein
MKPKNKIPYLKSNLISKIPAPFMLGAEKVKWNVFSKAHFVGFLQNRTVINLESVLFNFSRVLAFALKMSQQFFYSPLAVDTVQQIFRAEILKKVCEHYKIGTMVRCRKALLPSLYSRVSFLKKNWLLGKNINRVDSFNNNTYLNVKNSINLVFILNTDKSKYIIKDAYKFGVPFIALIGGDNTTNKITYPIPGNGRDLRSVRFFIELIAEAKIQGEKDRKKIEAKILKIIN